MEREEWATIRGELLENEKNKENLDIIQKCVFVRTFFRRILPWNSTTFYFHTTSPSQMISLDKNSPKNSDEFAFLTAAASSDRWYDKIFGLLIFENSKISCLLEHTPCDAPTIASWVRT